MFHERGCPIENRTSINTHSDAAKRITDAYNLHRSADPYGNVGYWFAAALDDGSSQDGYTLYESKPDAIKHQKHNENWYTFIQIVPQNMTECDAEVMLKVARMIYAKGGRISNGFSRHELIRRLGWEDQNALANGRVQNVLFGR